MLSRRALLATALCAGAGVASAAPSDRAMRSHSLPQEALPGAAVNKPLRAYRDVAFARVPAARAHAWHAFTAALPGLTAATWDTATGVPNRIWGRGLDVPGSVASPTIAAAAARLVLAQHLALLAPGASIDDFELVANVERRGLRSVGFVQRHGGVEVVGGQVSFRFKRDRLFVIGSEALPDVAVAAPRKLAAAIDVRAAAGASTVVAFGLDPTRVTTRAAAPVVLPLVGERDVLAYRLAVPVDVDAGAAGAWRVWTDAGSGAPLLRRSITPTAAGTVQFDSPERWTGRPRRDYVVPRLGVTVNGTPTETDAGGRIAWTGSAPATVRLTVAGPLVEVESLTGETATGEITVTPDGTGTWRPGTERALDAQLSAFVHASRVKEYVRGFAPELEFLDEQLPVKVNIDNECNAFSNGNAIHFFAESDRCENTATIADVVYHEFGHSMHAQSLVRGVGFFDGAFSEGLSDYLSATIVDDPAMARGFFRSDEPLRQLDPAGREHIWPRDIEEIHTTGIIFGGAMWDLRQALVAELGRTEGIALADRLFYGAVQRASSIPSTLVEILAEDDDDGDLANGTPHECTIRTQFGRHGLRTTLGKVDAPGAVASAVADPVPVTLTLEGLDHRCGDDIVSSVRLEWKPRGGGPATGSAEATAAADAWTAPLPMPMEGFGLFYRFRVAFADGSEMIFPDNRADPWYQFYRGDVVPLYCTDFETNPFTDGWRAGGDAADTWQWGAPGGSRGVGDPVQAFSGARIVGTGLSAEDGSYPNDVVTWLESPNVDVGDYSDVRLQYRRWLNAEDGFYDQATVEVNGEQAWSNVSSQGNSSHTTHFEDRGWLFHDIPLSSRIFDGTVTIRWMLDTDDSFALGGWNLDDVCIVANPRAVCGDGERNGAEQCDDGAGNADAADTCRTNCRIANCGDGIKDSIEACDDGNDDETDGCNTLCEEIVEPEPEVDGGCATGGAGAGLGGAFGLAAALGLLVRRRRRA